MLMLFCAISTCSSSSSRNCPTAEWFIAEFVAIIDEVVSAPLAFIQADTDLSFFRDVMLFTEEEIEQVTEDAIQFFNTMYGLDFSQSEPNELGQRFFQNATFFPFRGSPEVQYTVTFNRWIVSGNTRSVCFENREGGIMVQFSGEQILRGTYGGEEGIPVTAGDAVIYGFYNIPVCPQEPLVIRYTSGSPGRFDPRDGFAIINNDLFHRGLGRGLAQGLFRVVPTEDGRIRFTIRNVFTFPAHPTIAP